MHSVLSKIYLVASMSLFTLASLHATLKNKQEILETLKTIHPLVFDHENPLTTNSTQQALTLWQGFMGQVKSYAQENGPQFAKIYAVLEKADNDLINTLQLTYHVHLIPAIINDKDKETGVTQYQGKIDRRKLGIQAIDTAISPLRLVNTRLTKVQDDLRRLKLTAAQQKDTQQILSTIATQLQKVVDEVFRDFEKLKAFKAGKVKTT